MTAVPQKAIRIHPLLRRLALDYLFGIVVNIICAVVVTYVIRVTDSFLQSLVFSMCIGTLALLFIDGGRLLMWGDDMPRRLPFFVLIAVSVPTAYFLGSAAATRLLGLPPKSVDIGQSGHAVGVIILTILASLFMIWFFWSRNKLAQLEARAEAEKARTADIERQAMQAQLQLLQAQIEPHMLFNTLANLQGLIAVDTTRAQHLLEHLIHYLRATLSSSRARSTTLAQEFSLMDAYLGLMSLRMGPRLSYTLDLPEELRSLPMPPMLLQPLVENAIKHGLEPKIDGGRVDVRARREAQQVILTVADTGLGLDADTGNTRGTQVGLANVRERLQALYGDRASLALAPNAPAGVIAQLTIPL